MCVPLVHYFHSETSPVEKICPGVDHMALTVLDGLVEVETISRFLHLFLSKWRGLYLHLKEVSGANVVLREKRLTPTSL
jgi:hypothetical protein